MFSNNTNHANGYDDRDRMLAAALKTLTQIAHHYPQVRKDDLRAGDWVVIRTEQSEYHLRVLTDGLVEARGGWFDRKGVAPVTIGVAGATWGGSAIMPHVFAACGMSMEFRNRLITSPVRLIVVWPARLTN